MNTRVLPNIGADASRNWGAYGPTVLLLLSALALCIFMLVPLGTLLMGSVLDDQGRLSLSKFVEFASTPGVATATWNTLWVATLVTLIQSLMAVW